MLGILGYYPLSAPDKNTAANKVHRASPPDGSGVGRLLLREPTIGAHPTRKHLS